jgi:hypothetical protein
MPIKSSMIVPGRQEPGNVSFWHDPVVFGTAAIPSAI